MESPERPPIIDAITDATRPYSRLTEAQKARILADLLTEYALGNLRPVRTATVVTKTEQLDLF
jgi:hypothetical protein